MRDFAWSKKGGAWAGSSKGIDELSDITNFDITEF